MKHQKFQLWILALLLVSLPSFSTQAQLKKASGTKHSLWKVQDKEHTVYLLGSIHVLKQNDYPLNPAIESAFDNSRIVAFETDIDALQKPEVAMKMLLKGQLPAGETLSSVLPPAIYASFSNYVARTGMPSVMFDTLTPATASMVLVLAELKKLELDPELGLDKHFFDKAKEQSKKIVPLETPEFQISLITDFSKEEGELLMKSTLKDIATLEKDLGDMLKAWQTGDAEKLNNFLNDGMKDAPVIFKRMVTDRTRNWVPKVEALISGKENAIVIVGAGHLVGPEGLVELLKKKGHKVVQE